MKGLYFSYVTNNCTKTYIPMYTILLYSLIGYYCVKSVKSKQINSESSITTVHKALHTVCGMSKKYVRKRPNISDTNNVIK